MRRVSIPICLLLFVNAAQSSVKVEPLVPQECTDHLKVIVTLNGKPVKGAKLGFYRGFMQHTIEPRPLFSVTSNDAGIATPRQLSSGDYRVYVQFEGVRSAIFDGPVGTWLYLHVVHNDRGSSVSANLTEAVNGLERIDAEFERQVDEAEQSPSREVASKFRGTIVDPSGARVPDVRISVMKTASGVRTTLLRTTSGSKGEFSDQLKDGRYVAIFSAPGFRVAVVPFEISGASSENLLKVRLDIGTITE